MRYTVLLLLTLFFPVFVIGQPSAELAQAKTFYNEGQFNKVVTILDKMIETDQANFDTWLLKGNCFQKEGKFVAAVQAYEKAEKLNKNSALIQANLGAAYLNLDQFEKAAKKLSRSLKLDEDLPEGHYFTGNLAYFEFKTSTAIRSYSRAIKLKPGYRDALYMRGAAYAEMKQYNKALSDYESALEIDPGLQEAQFNIAVICLVNEEYERAVSLLAKLDPSTLPQAKDYHYYLGEALYYSDKKEEACEAYQMAADMGDAESKEIYRKYCMEEQERESEPKKRTIRATF